MVSTRGKKKTTSSNGTLEEDGAAENALDETLPSDAVTVTVEELKADAHLGDKEDASVDEANKENSEGINGEDESEGVNKLDNDNQNTTLDDKVELEENTFEDDELDDQEEMPLEDGEENTDHFDKTIIDEFDFSDEEVTEEDNEDDEDSEEEATEEEDEEDEVSDEEEIENEDGEEKEIAKQDATEAEAKKDDKKKEEHNTEKLEVSLKNKKKSSETSRKKVQADKLKKVDPKDKPESSRKRKAKKRVESMGMIFMCSSKTKKDCYQYRVLGLPESKKDIVEKIYTGMRLFLYDTDLKLMYGIFKAAGPGGYNIEPKAFKSQFPSQVRFKVLENCLPLAEGNFKTIIKDNYYTNTKFDCQLNSEQVKKLCKLFIASSKRRLPKISRRTRKAEKQPVQKVRTRKRRAVVERHLPLREEVKHERPRKRPRKVISPARQHPAPLPPAPLPPIVRSYAYERTSNGDAYRRDPYLERRSPYRDRRDRLLDRRDPYGDRLDPPIGRNDLYRDGRDTYLGRLYTSGDSRDPYVERRDPYRDDRDPYPKRRDPYGDGRDPYVELPNLYRDRQDPYTERRDSYRDGRDAYLERRLPYRDTIHSDLYSSSTYRRDPLSLSDREYRDSYRREELLERRDIHLSSGLESRPRRDIAGHDSYVSTRERPAYAEPIYPAEYPSRTGLYRI